MKKEKVKYEDVLEILENNIISNVMLLFQSAGKKITRGEAKNAIVKVGTKLLMEQLKNEKQ